MMYFIQNNTKLTPLKLFKLPPPPPGFEKMLVRLGLKKNENQSVAGGPIVVHCPVGALKHAWHNHDSHHQKRIFSLEFPLNTL